jgi:hypothetical protein
MLRLSPTEENTYYPFCGMYSEIGQIVFQRNTYFLPPRAAIPLLEPPRTSPPGTPHGTPPPLSSTTAHGPPPPLSSTTAHGPPPPPSSTMAHGMPPLSYTTPPSPLSTPALSGASPGPLPRWCAAPPGTTRHRNVLVALHFWITKQTKPKIGDRLKHWLEEFVCATVTFHACFEFWALHWR